MPLARELFQEGLIIPPVRLQRRGVIDEAVLDLITRNSRTPDERLGDLSAQLRPTGRRAAAAGVGRRYGAGVLGSYMAHLQAYAEAMAHALIRRMPPGRYCFSDVMDDDGFGAEDIAIRVAVETAGDALVVDFTGTAAEVMGGINAVHG